MKQGKQTCRILKEIRRQIAEANDIEFITSECRYQGDCLGTCPKCEEEVRYLERELRRRQLAGRAVTLFGLSTGLLVACGNPSGTAQANGEDTASARVVDTVFEESPAGPLAGKVVDEPIILDGDVDVSNSINPELDTLDTSVTSPVPILVSSGIVFSKPKVSIGDINLGPYLPDAVPVKAEYPGGEEALKKLMDIHLSLPEGKASYSEKPLTIVSFVINPEGEVTEEEVIHSTAPQLDSIALARVKAMPRWKPGRLEDGQEVYVKYSIPFRFHIE